MMQLQIACDLFAQVYAGFSAEKVYVRISRYGSGVNAYEIPFRTRSSLLGIRRKLRSTNISPAIQDQKAQKARRMMCSHISMRKPARSLAEAVHLSAEVEVLAPHRNLALSLAALCHPSRFLCRLRQHRTTTHR
jgi:hypothetical protein